MEEQLKMRESATIVRVEHPASCVTDSRETAAGIKGGKAREYCRVEVRTLELWEEVLLSKGYVSMHFLLSIRECECLQTNVRA